MKTFTLIFLLLFSSHFLSGCTTAVVGGAVVGTSVALDKRTTGDYVEDQNIKAKFTYLYIQDNTLSEQTHINVTSYNRQVLITGEAASEREKQQLSNLIKQIKNVRRHYNEVAIAKPSSFSSRSNDTYLTGKIKTSILSHIKELEGAQVKVVTENGTVFLMGLVSRQQADKITQIVRTTRGVKRVIKLFEYVNSNDNRI